MIVKHSIDEVYFSYSDVSHEHVMDLASRAQAAGASFVLLGPKETMLKSNELVIAVTAVRTGAGKSSLSRMISSILALMDKKFVVIRHSMPYGDLSKQVIQRFANFKDIDKINVQLKRGKNINPIKNNVVVFSGVDYAKILKEAEKEADIIIWDGGNNDIPFIRPDLQFIVADAMRPLMSSIIIQEIQIFGLLM